MTGSEGYKTNPVLDVVCYLGAAVILFMALMTVVDVAGRYLFNSPLGGAFELTGLMLSIIAGFGIALATAAEQHIRVDALFEKLSVSKQRILILVSALISLGIYAVLTWQGAIAVRDSLVPYVEIALGEVGIVIAPFRFALALGFFLSVIATTIQIIGVFRRRGNSSSTIPIE